MSDGNRTGCTTSMAAVGSALRAALEDNAAVREAAYGYHPDQRIAARRHGPSREPILTRNPSPGAIRDGEAAEPRLHGLAGGTGVEICRQSA